MSPAERRLLREAAAVRPLLGIAVACGIAGGLLLIPQAWLMAGAITDAFLHHAGIDALAWPAVLVALLFAGRALLGLAAETAGQVAASRVRSRLRRHAVEAVLAARPAALAEERSGELVTTLTRGVDALDGYFGRYLPQLVVAVVVPVAIIVWAAPRDLLAAAIMAVTVPLVPLFMALVGLATRERTQRRWAGLAALGAYFLDLVRGLPTLRAFGRGAEKEASVREAGERYRRATMGALRGAFLSSLVLELAATVSTALVAVAIGLRLDAGTLDLRTGLAVLVLVPEVYLPLRKLGTQFHTTLEALAPAERIHQLVDGLPQPAGGSRTAPDLRSTAIELAGVSFSRPDRGVVLDGLSARIEPGEHVALVGVSGSGKSTLLALLLGFETPDRGAVLVGGQDLRDLDLRLHREQVAWQPQRPALLAGTLAENLRLGARHADRRRLHEVADHLGLEGLLERQVGEGGRQLSAGQRQRAGLARAALRDAPLILLDEPTAHLDALTERQVLQLLRGWRHRTVVVATHSPSLVEACDRVLELRDGHLVEQSRTVAV